VTRIKACFDPGSRALRGGVVSLGLVLTFLLGCQRSGPSMPSDFDPSKYQGLSGGNGTIKSAENRRGNGPGVESPDRSEGDERAY